MLIVLLVKTYLKNFETEMFVISSTTTSFQIVHEIILSINSFNLGQRPREVDLIAI